MWDKFRDDPSEKRTRELFPEIIHGFTAECLRSAIGFSIPENRLATFEPFGVAYAALHVLWASRSRTERRRQMLRQLAMAYPANRVKYVRTFVKQKGENPTAAVQNIIDLSPNMLLAFDQHFDKYFESINHDIDVLEKIQQPAVLFSTTTRIFSGWFLPAEFHPNLSNDWVFLAHNVARLMVCVADLEKGN